jgi:hypothetical protein
MKGKIPQMKAAELRTPLRTILKKLILSRSGELSPRQSTNNP